MERKRNEKEVGILFRKLGYYAHKWGDIRFARCPKCFNTFMLPKAEKKPDFLIAISYAFVEAKSGIDAWRFSGDFRPNQIEFMNANEDLSWVFVEVGPGNAPINKLAFLIPWAKWKETEEVLLAKGYKSILFKRDGKSRNPEIQEVIPAKYFLVWGKSHWNIPETHPWFINYPKGITQHVPTTGSSGTDSNTEITTEG